MGKDVLSGKGLGKANTFKRSEYSPLSSELEKQTDIAKDEHKYFKNQTNVIYNNRKDELKAADGVKVEVDEIANVSYFYIGNKSNNLIDKIFKQGLIDRDQHLTNFDNRQLGFTNIIKNYLKEKNDGVDNKFFSFEKSIKNLENIHDKANIMSDYYKTMIKTDYEN